MGAINKRGIHPCTGCDRPTRPKHSTREQYPGAVQRVCAGKCKPCHNAAHRPAPPAALRSFLAARQARAKKAALHHGTTTRRRTA